MIERLTFLKSFFRFKADRSFVLIYFLFQTKKTSDDLKVTNFKVHTSIALLQDYDSVSVSHNTMTIMTLTITTNDKLAGNRNQG